MRALLAAFSVLLITAAASAEKVPGGGSDDVWVARGSCDLTDYKSFSADLPTPVSIPDGTGTPIIIGPIPTGPPTGGPPMVDVAVEIDISHTYVGDLTIDVIYDVNCDGVGGADDVVVGLLCRPGCDCLLCASFGCAGDFAGSYLFSDVGDATWEGLCPVTIAPGCIAADLESTQNTPLSTFDGLVKGGCFYVSASDAATPDPGSISGVTIWTMNDTGVPTTELTWGQIKAKF